jgi:hypothetical protein
VNVYSTIRVDFAAVAERRAPAVEFEFRRGLSLFNNRTASGQILQNCDPRCRGPARDRNPRAESEFDCLALRCSAGWREPTGNRGCGRGAVSLYAATSVSAGGATGLAPPRRGGSPNQPRDSPALISEHDLAKASREGPTEGLVVAFSGVLGSGLGAALADIALIGTGYPPDELRGRAGPGGARLVRRVGVGHSTGIPAAGHVVIGGGI